MSPKNNSKEDKNDVKTKTKIKTVSEVHHGIHVTNVILMIGLGFAAAEFLSYFGSIISYILVIFNPDFYLAENIVTSNNVSGFIDLLSNTVIYFVGILILKFAHYKTSRGLLDGYLSDRFYLWPRYIAIAFNIIMFIDTLNISIVSFLNGNVTLVGTLLDLIIIIVVSLLVWYVVFERYSFLQTKKTKKYVASIILFIVAVIVCFTGYFGFKLYGTPEEVRASKVDVSRVNDLARIKSTLGDYLYTQKAGKEAELPRSLDDLVKKNPELNIYDPVTKNKYDYTYSVEYGYATSTDVDTEMIIVSTSTITKTFSVCAIFTYDYAQIIKWNSKNSLPYGMDADKLKKGKSCFEETYDGAIDGY